MNTYLAIITTALVVTQIIRLAQNAVQLHKLSLVRIAREAKAKEA